MKWNNYIISLTGSQTQLNSIFLKPDYDKEIVELSTNLFFTQNCKNSEIFEPHSLKITQEMRFSELIEQNCLTNVEVEAKKINLDKVADYIQNA